MILNQSRIMVQFYKVRGHQPSPMGSVMVRQLLSPGRTENHAGLQIGSRTPVLFCVHKRSWECVQPVYMSGSGGDF